MAHDDESSAGALGALAVDVVIIVDVFTHPARAVRVGHLSGSSPRGGHRGGVHCIEVPAPIILRRIIEVL